MINYIIINGTNSNTINGLGINELPPISKPPLRVQTEEIDGRDGDISTNLGYGAYDKTISIGLFGTGYDINEVISFFNGEGTVVFSNEPDKYYKYKIINQIDYEALLKFKSATITFHCQPFKYPLEETPLEIEYEYIEQEGVESATMNNTYGDASLKIDLKGNTSQTGTPTPDSPIPINVVSGDNEVVVCGKNLFDKNGLTYRNGYYLNDNGVEQSQSSIGYTSNILVKPNTQYTIQGTLESNDGYLRIYYFDSSQNWISRTSGITVSSIPYTFTTPNNCGYVAIQYQKASLNKDDVMLESGNTASPYEPYQSQTYPINLGTLELCKIGDYQDYFYKDSGKWYLHKEIGKVVLDGTQSIYAINTSSTNTTRLTYKNAIENLVGSASNILCSSLLQSNNWSNDVEGISYDSANGNIWFRINKTTIGTTQESANTYLSNNNMTIYAPITPTNTEITDNTLIGQLEAIRQATSYDTQTNVSQVNNDLPFIISAKAMKKDTNEVEVENIGNVYSRPTLDIKGTGIIDIYKDNVQILQVDMNDNNEIVIENMEAYNPSTSELMNRKVVGDYNKITIPSGTSTIKASGELEKLTITNYIRWL